MKTNNSYFSRILVILIAVMMVFTMMPSMAFAADSADTTESNEQAQTCPVTIKAGENAMSATATGEKLSSDYNGVADVFEVAVAPEIDKITVGDYQNGKILVYNYDAEKNWLAGYYENGGTEGVTQTEVSVDYNKDNVADYIWVQTPYVAAEGQGWPTSSLICVIKLVYQLPVEVTIGGKTVETTDTWVKDGYTYKDAYSNDKSDLYILHAPAGTNEAVIQKKDKKNFLAYNYGKNGYIAGSYEDTTAGAASADVKLDANGDGAADYIRIQNLYNADWTGGELLYTLQFVVEGGLPNTTQSIPALSDFEQQEAIKKAVKSLSGKKEYCYDSDWITAFYANGGTLSETDVNTYLKKVYGDIVASAQLSTLAKDVIALTAMGYDPRNIKDTAGKSYNLLEQIYNSNIADLGPYGIYTAPYILLAYDTFNFELPKNASLSRDVLIKYMLEAQAADGSWGGYTYAGVSYPGTAGDTASVAQALLPYAATDASVKASIEKANAFIDKNSEKSKDSTNYLAYITLYEALQGKKASEIVVDEEAGTDVIDYLLSNKLQDDTFGYQSANTNESATVEAFKALTAYKNITDGVDATSGNIYNSQGRYWNGLQPVSSLPAINDALSDIFITAPKKLSYKIGETIDLTGLTVTAQTIGGTKKEVSIDGITANPSEITSGTQLSYSGFDTTSAGTKTVTVKYEEFDNFVNKSIGKTADFIITVSANDGSSSEKVNTVSIGVYDETGKSLVKDSAYIINAGTTTVMDVLKAVLGNAGKTYVLKASGTYIAEIDGLGEFDKGQNSGWMYKVDGKLPDIPANAYKLNGSEKIEWFYTKDWTTVPGTIGGKTEEIKNVTSDTKAGTTTAPTDVKVGEKISADGTKTKVADVKVSAENQKEILKQAKANKSKEIILNVSKSAVGDAAKADVTLDKSFIDSIVKDTNAKLTIKTPFGDKTYTQEELKAMSAAATGSTISIAVEKAAEEPADDAAAKVEKAKSIVKDMKLTARSSKTAKKNVKAVLKNDAKTKAAIKELKELGFTVKYKFYRSTKKSASYKSAITKKVASYTNTSGKNSTKYFYKVQVRVYDENGKLVAKTALKQCKYASRTWTK